MIQTILDRRLGALFAAALSLPSLAAAAQRETLERAIGLGLDLASTQAVLSLLAK